MEEHGAVADVAPRAHCEGRRKTRIHRCHFVTVTEGGVEFLCFDTRVYARWRVVLSVGGVRVAFHDVVSGIDNLRPCTRVTAVWTGSPLLARRSGAG